MLSMFLIPTFLVLICVPDVAAVGLDLEPLNTATFSVYVVLAAYTLFQALRAFAILCRPHPKASNDRLDTPSERVPYTKVFLATLTISTCYVLLAIWIPLDLSRHSFDTPAIIYGVNAVDELSDVFIASAILHFIDHRRDALSRAHDGKEPFSVRSISSAKKRLLDTVLLSFMVATNIARLVVGVLTRTLSNPDLAFTVYDNLFHVYIALYFAATLDIALSALFLWSSLGESATAKEKITRVILKHIVPLLVVRVLFRLALDVVTSLRSTSFNINFNALRLVEAVVESILYAVVLNMTLSLARPVAVKEEEKEAGN